MLDRWQKFEFSIESSVGQEQTGLEYEPDQQHAERIISETWSWKRAIQCPHFACKKACQQRSMVVEGAEMDDKEARRIQALAARLNYLEGDRPDLLIASKCICKNMTRPRKEDWIAP